jgi:potassium intermediate/small conductance calcium-activated channel subfamily N protein 2
MLGVEITRTFALRSIFASDPYFFLIYSIAILVFTFTFMIRVIEGPVSLILKDSIDYNIIQNCIWNVIVTMTTVGYGDYVPRSFFGRMVMIFAALTGTTLLSFMVVALQFYLRFSENEAKVTKLFTN